MLIKYKIISALVPTIGAGVAATFYLTRSKGAEAPTTSEIINKPIEESINNKIDGDKNFSGTTSQFGGMKKFEIGSREALENIKKGLQ